jgi:ABC-type transport system substrate-binding protein
MQTVDERARAQVYAECQQRIMAEALIVPIREWVNLNVTWARVKGLRYDAQGWFPWLYDVKVE